MIEADVAVIGAGPAGVAAALTLAPHRDVMLIERRATPSDRIGESLPAAAHRLLRVLGVWEAFEAQAYRPCHVHRSRWGSALPDERDALRDLDGHGWHIDRAKFEQGLRDAAVARGAIQRAPAQPHAIARQDGVWEIMLDDDTRVRAKLLIDAGGRTSTALKPFGAQRQADDKLACGWLSGLAEPDPMGLTYIESEPDGWWYTAPLPGGRRVLAFHTDADLDAAADAHAAPSLVSRAARLPALAEVLQHARFDATEDSGFCSANGAVLAPPAGEGWFAVGDAALALDPLSSQGLFNALYTGHLGGRGAAAVLAGNTDASALFCTELASIRDAYRSHLVAFYGAERRFADASFWRRRMSS